MFTIHGTVGRGRGYGKTIGYPTANLDRRHYSRLQKKPRLGVYAGEALVKRTNRRYKAGIVIGPPDRRARLPARQGLPRVEAHLLGFTGVLYGEKVTLSLRKYLRRFVSFRNDSVLKKQILKDMKRVRKIVKLT
jgi:riboflavin kinase/FMN adenylyltransferase